MKYYLVKIAGCLFLLAVTLLCCGAMHGIYYAYLTNGLTGFDTIILESVVSVIILFILIIGYLLLTEDF